MYVSFALKKDPFDFLAQRHEMKQPFEKNMLQNLNLYFITSSLLFWIEARLETLFFCNLKDANGI